MCVDVPWRLEDVVRCSARCAVLELPGISGTVGAESMLCGSKVCTLSTGSRSQSELLGARNPQICYKPVSKRREAWVSGRQFAVATRRGGVQARKRQ